MNPITIIRERIAESRRREEGVTEGPWCEDMEGAPFCHVVAGNPCLPEAKTVGVFSSVEDALFIASARSDLPMWRSIAERAVEALEGMHFPHPPYGDLELPEDKTCSACDIIESIAQQLAEGGIEG